MRNKICDMHHKVRKDTAGLVTVAITYYKIDSKY